MSETIQKQSSATASALNVWLKWKKRLTKWSNNGAG